MLLSCLNTWIPLSLRIEVSSKPTYVTSARFHSFPRGTPYKLSFKFHHLKIKKICMIHSHHEIATTKETFIAIDFHHRSKHSSVSIYRSNYKIKNIVKELVMKPKRNWRSLASVIKPRWNPYSWKINLSFSNLMKFLLAIKNS